MDKKSKNKGNAYLVFAFSLFLFLLIIEQGGIIEKIL